MTNVDPARGLERCRDGESADAFARGNQIDDGGCMAAGDVVEREAAHRWARQRPSNRVDEVVDVAVVAHGEAVAPYLDWLAVARTFEQSRHDGESARRLLPRAIEIA